MKIFKTQMLSTFALLLLSMLGVFVLVAPSVARADRISCPDGSTVQTGGTCPDGSAGQRFFDCPDGKSIPQNQKCADGSTPTAPQFTTTPTNTGPVCDPRTGMIVNSTDPQAKSIICSPSTCASKTTDSTGQVSCNDCNIKDPSSSCNLFKYINLGISFLSVAIGIVVVIMIIIGGIQYTAAGGDPNAVAKAKKRIFNAIFALVAFGLLYAVIQWLVPGGIF